MKRTPSMVALALLARFAAGCSSDHRSSAESHGTSTAKKVPGIVLPAGTNRSLAQAPGDGTREGAVYAAAVVHATDGIITSFRATVVMPDRLDLPDGTTVGCGSGCCALVAYDAGWPDRVLATFKR